MRVHDVFRKLNIGKRAVALMLAALVAVTPAIPAIPANAAVPTTKTLTLKACRSLALANSTEYESAEINVEAKKAAYESAVKAINLKESSMKQFRWSPLLNFKFPTSPNFAESSEFKYKPISLQYEVQTAQHKLQDQVFAINEKTNNLYVEIVVLQDTIAFNEKRLEATKDGLAKNQAKLRLGTANKSDVDKLEKKVTSLTSKISSDRSTLEADLKKLSNMVGMDVSTGYKFEKPFLEATIERSQLDALIQYTEDRDQTYYEACTNEVSLRAELTINSKLIEGHFGGDYNIIKSFVTAALNGESVNKKAFTNKYKEFLTKIDSYWSGKKRILFIKIPRLWFKGDLDGTRYIEDDPQVLKTNVLDYSQAVIDKRAAKEELDQSVTDTFNNYISVRNSYKQYIKDVDDAEASLEKDALRNRIGELSFEEYDSAMESYEELQNNMLDTMKLYTTTLNGFDRLTCGGISALLSGTDADLHTAVVGESYIEENIADGAYYTLKPIIQEQIFELTVVIPDDFEVDITDYELWVNNEMVGTRTAKDKKLRHLMLAMDAVDEAKIRLYNGDEFVHDCVIDPSVESGPLSIRTGFDIKRDDPSKIGTYEIAQNETTGLVELKFTLNDDMKDVKGFKVKNAEGKVLGQDKIIEIDKPLVYVELLSQSLPDLTIEFYDESEAVLVTARFDEANGAVLRKEE